MGGDMSDMMDATTMEMMADSPDMQEAMSTMQDMMHNSALMGMDGMKDHLKEMAGMLKWETMDEFYAEYGYEVEKMKAKMEEDPEMMAMKEEMDSMIAKDKRELHDRMAPYAMHMKFKMCVGMPHMMEMMHEMKEMAEEMGMMMGEDKEHDDDDYEKSEYSEM